jgi:hypothetical protein
MHTYLNKEADRTPRTKGTEDGKGRLTERITFDYLC